MGWEDFHFCSMLLDLLFYLLVIFLVESLPVTQNTLVAVKCAAASGTINCDWKCFDNCIYDKPQLLSGVDFKECLAAIGEPCLVPATTYLTLDLSDHCYQSEPQLEGHTYNVVVPQLKDDLWLKLHSQAPHEVTLSIASDEFNSTSCLASVVRFGLASTSGRTEPCSDSPIDADFSQIDAPFTFGFTQLSVNITEWAALHVDAATAIGDHEQVLHLFSGSACAGKPSSMTLSYSSDIVIDSSDYNAVRNAHRTISVIALLSLFTTHL